MSTPPSPASLGTLAQLWRYPVKSMHGEALAHVLLTPFGLDQDRLYAFESPQAPPGMLRLTSTQRRAMLPFQATSTPEGVEIHTPAGDDLPVTSPALLRHLPPGLHLTHAPRPQTDVRPVSLISLQTIAQLSRELNTFLGTHEAPPLDPRHFRANLYLDLPTLTTGPDSAFPEDVLIGRTLQIGPTARLRILERDPRCRFFSLHPETTEPNPDLMRLLHRRHDSRVGLYASVLTPGQLSRTDRILLSP